MGPEITFDGTNHDDVAEWAFYWGAEAASGQEGLVPHLEVVDRVGFAVTAYPGETVVARVQAGGDHIEFVVRR